MKLTILGSGTSHGVPVIGCTCAVCKSKDKKDNRLRCSALLTVNKKNYLIDVGPDFRTQALRLGLNSLESVFLTHTHADHLHGIDDLRIFSHKNSVAMQAEEPDAIKYPETTGEGLAIYMSGKSAERVKSCFPYIFSQQQKGGGIPKLNIITCDQNDFHNPIIKDSFTVVPIPLVHGYVNSFGWLFTSKDSVGKKHSIAYLTDCNFISESSLQIVKDCCSDGVLEHLVIDALRAKPHSSHNNFEQALFYANIIGAKNTWFTHLTHDFLHIEICKYIDEHLSKYEKLQSIVQNGGSVKPSYDGLVLSC